MESMNRRSLLRVLGVSGALVCFSKANWAFSKLDEEVVERVYVIRRNLGGDGGFPKNVGVVAHSGLLLKTAKAYYVLEYMGDSKVYLTETKQEVVKEFKEDKYAHVKLTGRSDDTEKQMNWTRQLDGKALPEKLRPVDLKEKMESIVKEYSVWKKEHCHNAQEKLREALRIKD